MLADIGPIPESEVERLEPLVIDHTMLQRMSEAPTAHTEEDAKLAAQMLKDEDEERAAATERRRVEPWG